MSGNVTVNWSVPNDNANGNQAYAIFDYFVYNANGQLECSTGSNTPNATSCTFHHNDTAPLFGYAYNQPIQFYVVAHNESGTNSPDSALSNSITPTVTPNHPYSIYVTYDTNNSENYNGGDGLVHWTVPGDNGNPIVSYTVNITTAGSAWGPYQSQTIVVNGANTNQAYFAGLVQGANYNVTVTATNQLGTTSGDNSGIAYTIPTTAPWGNSSVTNLTATDNPNGSVTLNWSSPGNNGAWSTSYYTCGPWYNRYSCNVWNSQLATSFSIYNTDGTFVATVTGTSYTTGVLHLNSINKNTLGYQWVVVPSDNYVYGNYATSNVAYPTIWPTNIGTPSAEPNIDGSVFIAWLVPNDNGNPITSYQVYSNPSGMPVCTNAQINTLQEGDYTYNYCTTQPAQTNASNPGAMWINQSVNFYVVATNELGQTDDSNSSNSVTPFIGVSAPTSVTATSNNDGTVTVSWTPGAAVAGSPVASYMAMASTDGGNNWFPICSVDAINNNDATSCSTLNSGYTQLTPGVNYTFEVVAYNTQYSESDSNPPVWECVVANNESCPTQGGTEPTTTATPGVRPSFAGNVVAIDNMDGTMTVNFTASSDDPLNLGYPIIDYGVFLYNPEGGIGNEVCDLEGNLSALTCTFPISNFNGVLGTDYQFVVAAANSQGESWGWTSSSDLTNNPMEMPTGSQISTPVAPTTVPGTSAISNLVVNNDGSISITWGAAVDNGTAVTGYTVYNAANNAVCSTTGALTCTTNQLTSGTSYSFYVVATNADGNGANGPTSNVVTAEITPVWTATPTLAKNADHSFTISWTAPTTYGKAVTYVVYNAANNAVVCHTTDLSCRTVSQSAANDTFYSFYVIATNTVHNSTTSPTTGSLEFAGPATWTSAPLAIANSNNSVTIAWNAPDAYSSPLSYTLYQVGGGVVCHTTGLTCSTAANTAKAGMSYSYYVVATNEYNATTASANSNKVAFAAAMKAALPKAVTVTFATGSSTLTAADKVILKALAAQLKAGNHVVVTGFSSKGTSFSAARAKAVEAYLKSLKAGLVFTTVDGGNHGTPSATVVTIA